MTPSDFEWVQTEEEPRLAEHLVRRVLGRAAGTFDDECTRNAPRDKYFIGSLRPRPLNSGDNSTHRSSFLDELLNKLAPMAFGAEFKVRPTNKAFRLRLRLEWDCYYRAFPTLEEQREHQRLLSSQPDRLDTDGTLSGGLNSSEAAPDNGENDEAQTDNHVQVSSATGVAVPLRRRRSTDTLSVKYRKVHCSAEGFIALGLTTDDAGTWSADASDIQKATEREFARVRDCIFADPNRLRTGSNPDSKVRVPVEALESTEAYEGFKNTLRMEINPAWRWSLQADFRLDDNSGCILVAFQATNDSDVDTTSWHTEGFFFDVRACLRFEGADVLPFELEVAPKGFRYDRYLWGRGFNCGVIQRDLEGGGQYFETVNAPLFSQPRFSTSTEPIALFTDLATDPVPILRRVLDAMREYDRSWIEARTRYTSTDPSWDARHGTEFDNDHARFPAEIERFERGCHLIEREADVRLAFQLTNRTFALGDQKTAWRLFQLVFIVSQIPVIYSLTGRGEAAISDRSVVDIIYFPTGGGKTEAYLGVIVFHCFFDRLRGKTAGVTTWTRFPLRLLTLQQTQRVADVVGAAEIVRASHPDPLLSGKGIDGFAVGYFVGQEATPNELTPPGPGDPPDPNWSSANDPDMRQKWKKIVKCPVCRTPTVRVDFDATTVRLIHRCTNSGCRFPGGAIPVYVIDNEIYRYLPAVVVGTIDKLAGLGNQRKLGLVFGLVTGRCIEHGYYNTKCCQKNCTDLKRLRRGAPLGITAPTLFIQDELHLLKEGLGTFDGHYETFLQTLLQSLGHSLPAKIIASSATIEAFDRQVTHLYGRQARIFPGLGPTLGESFYARTLDFPQRLFVGLLPHNKTIFNALLELIQYCHEEVQVLQRLPVSASNPYGGRVQPATEGWYRLLDPYTTSLAYFSATRELSSMRTDLEAHTNVELEHGGFEPLRIAELSGSTSSDNVSRILEQLETSQPVRNNAPNVILATSMISHGVDIDRLNCMFYYGMPKQNAEYIQSSSRVGRSHVGLVFCCMKPARERDQSHFAYFEKYHEFLGRLVEPVAINRWSKFSVQRTVPGLFMGVLLQRIANLSGNDNPNRYYMVDFVKKLISQGSLRADDFVPFLNQAYLTETPGAGAAAFEAEIAVRVRQFLDQIVGAGGQTTFVSDALVPSPMRSLRDVDEPIEIELDSAGSTWASRMGR